MRSTGTRARSFFLRTRFAVYGVVAGASAAGIALTARRPAVLLPALILSLTLGAVGLDIYQSLFLRVGRLLVMNRRLLEEVGELRRRSENLQHRSEIAHSAMLEMSIGLTQTRAAAERSQSRRAAMLPRARPRVLFVTSNGSGMGHLTRLTAIALAGRPRFDSTFVSLSTAAEVVACQGFDVIRIASQQLSGLTWPEWNRRFSECFDRLLGDIDPQVVVFDGIRVFRGVHERSRYRGIPLAWVCRGLWKHGIDASQVRNWRDVADLLILPTEGALASMETSRPGGVEGGLPVDPIVHVDPKTRIARLEALRELGLSPDHRYVLIQLGSGALSDRSEWEHIAARSVHSLGPEWRPVHLQSPLARPQSAVDADAVVLRRYPIAAYHAAFDFSITAAGYNTVHEHIALAQPAIYIPDAGMLADDQPRRAKLLADQGGGLVVEDPASLPDAVSSLAVDQTRRAMIAALRRLETPSGAERSAQAIDDLATTPPDALASVWFRMKKEG